MSLISVLQLKPGMVLEQAVFQGENCLLKAGTALSVRNIQKLRELEVEKVDVADYYAFAYVWNKDDDTCSEFGTITLSSFGGGIRRIG